MKYCLQYKVLNMPIYWRSAMSDYTSKYAAIEAGRSMMAEDESIMECRVLTVKDVYGIFRGG